MLPTDDGVVRAEPVRPLRRLLIRPGAIGDFVVSLPALEFLRADYTEVWAAEQNVPLVRFADRVRSIQATGLNLVELGQAPVRLVEELGSFDEIVSWYGSNRAEFRESVAALPFRFFPALPEGGSMHAVDFYSAQVGAPAGLMPRVPVERGDGGYCVIHPFSGSRRKNWPLERFRELGGCLEQRIPVKWCAGPEEPLEGACRFDDLYALAEWLGRARLFVGNDSGIAHLAAAVGTPVVAIFGPSNPLVWAPRGRGVMPVRGQPLEALEAERVLRLAFRALDQFEESSGSVA